MTKFGGWMAGVVSAVIAGFLVWYLTQPPPTTVFEGMVYDSGASVPVPNAMILVQIDSLGESFHSATNSHGSYNLTFVGLKKSSKANLQITANGFAPFSIPSFAVEEDNRHDAPLAYTQTPRPPVHYPRSSPPRYIPVPRPLVTRIQIPSRP